MPAEKILHALKRLANRITGNESRPAPRLRSFSRSLSSLLQAAAPPQDVVSCLLAEALRQKASDINIEPTEEGGIDVYFRIDGILYKAASLSGDLAQKLRAATHSQAHSHHPGQYGVLEGTLSLNLQGKEFAFHIYDIPQSTENCILIRPTVGTSAADEANRPRRPAPHRPRNIDKKIFIWQMGKVGSLSVYSSLFRYSRPCDWHVPSIKYDTHWPKRNNIIQTHSIKLLYDFLHYSDEEFVIISLVRDLMARNISSIFQSMNFKEEWRNHFYIASVADLKKMPYEQQELEITKQLYKLNTSNLTTGWYDTLLSSHFYYPDIDKYLIDVYAKPFNQEQGFQTYESKTPRVQMIILRLEDLNARGKELGEFLGIEDFHPAWGNAPEGKWYEPIYKQFKSRYRPTEQELKTIYGSRFMRYFYSPEQINSMIAKWSHLGSTEQT